jgi:hypothetical protein
VGDLITKGPKSREVLKLFMSDKRLSSVIGNHDLTLRRRWNGEDVKLKKAQKHTNKELKAERDTFAVYLNFSALHHRSGNSPGSPRGPQDRKSRCIRRRLEI